MNLTQWLLELEPEEQGYVRRVWQYLQGTNGGVLPDIPMGMSQTRADILRCHCQALNNGDRGHRKMEESKPRSIRMTDRLHDELAIEAAEILPDLSWSEYVLRCINAGRPQVRAFPENEFRHPVLRPSHTRSE